MQHWFGFLSMDTSETTPLPPPGGPRSPRPASGPTLVEWAHEHLLSMLVSRQIAPGARIGIDAVARRLGISQTPIREALSRLEAEKLVHKVTNVGYRASAQMTREEVNDLYVLRLLIEPYAAARAAESMTDESLHILAEMQQKMAQIQTGSGVAYARFAEADSMLHHLVATGSGNRLIADTIERLHVHLHIFRFLYSTNAPEEAAEEHKRIIDALLAHDPAAAEAAMRDHLERSRVRLDRASSQTETALEEE
jgi:DNA-binding GntR family transcriptional regulator